MLSKDDVIRITDLLTIVEKIAGVAPGFMSISGEAMAELRQIDKAIREEAPKPDPSAQPGMPSTAPVVPSQPVGPRAIPSSTFDQFNSDAGLLARRLPSGSDSMENDDVEI